MNRTYVVRMQIAESNKLHECVDKEMIGSTHFNFCSET